MRLTRLLDCDVCKVSLAATSLKRHKKTVHGDATSGKQWKCRTCSKCLQTKSRLLQHERSHANMPKPNELSCQECKYITDNKDYLRDHQRKMHQAKEGMWMCIKGSCAEKPKSFINNQLLSRHQLHHENLPCNKCQKTFGAKKNMVRHLNTVHKEAEGENGADEPHNDIPLDIPYMDLTNVDVSDLLVMPLDPLNWAIWLVIIKNIICYSCYLLQLEYHFTWQAWLVLCTVAIHLFGKLTSGPRRNLGGPWSKIIGSFWAGEALR